MCKVCEHKISRRSPITIGVYWTDTVRSATITSNLTKCTIAIPDDTDHVDEELPWLFCPHCGKKLSIMPCETFKDVVEREG